MNLFVLSKLQSLTDLLVDAANKQSESELRTREAYILICALVCVSACAGRHVHKNRTNWVTTNVPSKLRGSLCKNSQIMRTNSDLHDKCANI